MTTTIRILYSQYKYVNEELADPRTEKWFLVGSPVPVILITIFYLYFVSSIGPAFMKKRQPYNLHKVMSVYNILQIVCNAYLLREGILVGWFWKFKLICEPVDYSNNPESMRVASGVWFYFILKILDLVDTIFFVLRKKLNQASFLHIYHHAGMVGGTWVCVKYLPGGHGTFLGLVNSFVHMFMYTHYLLALWKLDKPWWKKYLTQLQIFQFFAIFVQFSLAIIQRECAYPKWALVTFLPQDLFMIVLFGEFYYKTYIKTKPAKVDQNGVPSNEDSKQNGIELPNGKSKTY